MDNHDLKDLKIEVTYECPLICIHCSSDASPASLPKIRLDKCLSIISEAAEMSVKKIAFSGGEPLLYNGIEVLTKAAADAGMNVTIYTTGNILDISGRLRSLKESGLDSLAFSIYAPTAKEHELITRISGSFERTIFAIKEAIKNSIKVEIHFVALKRNYKFLVDVVNLAMSLNVPKVSVLRFVPQGRGNLISNQILNKEEFLELQENIKNIRKSNFNLRTGSPLNFLLVNDEPVCNSAIDRLLIDAELNISPCDAFKQIKAEEIVNTSSFSTLKTNSLKDCWIQSPYLNEIRNFLESDFDKPCKICNDLEKCLSGCLAQKTIQYGKLIKTSDPSCLNQ